MRFSFPCVASQPSAGGLPPLVFKRWMYVTLERTPSPECPVAASRSHATEPASGEATLFSIFPVTWLLSFHSQVGPVKCRPTALPLLSNNLASGPFRVQAYLPPSFLQV